jgi:hypothetical protein
MRRDADRLFDEDNFQIILDTFNDSRNGDMFVTTPLGAKLEQQISEEGEATRAGLLNLSSEPQLSRNDVKLPYGDFLANLAILRVDFAISPRATIRSLTQYDSLTSASSL